MNDFVLGVTSGGQEVLVGLQYRAVRRELDDRHVPVDGIEHGGIVRHFVLGGGRVCCQLDDLEDFPVLIGDGEVGGLQPDTSTILGKAGEGALFLDAVPEVVPEALIFRRGGIA